jgi:hypothetical protein
MPDENVLIVWNENFPKNSSSRIGIEMRNQSGESPVKEYITSANEVATFPVVKTVGKNSVLIAYTQTINNKDFIKYKIVEF